MCLRPSLPEQQGIDISSDGRAENAKTVAHYIDKGETTGDADVNKPISVSEPREETENSCPESGL